MAPDFSMVPSLEAAPLVISTPRQSVAAGAALRIATLAPRPGYDVLRLTHLYHDVALFSVNPTASSFRCDVHGLDLDGKWIPSNTAGEPLILPLFYTLPATAAGVIETINNGGAARDTSALLLGYYDRAGAPFSDLAIPGARSRFLIFKSRPVLVGTTETTVLQFQAPQIGRRIRVYGLYADWTGNQNLGRFSAYGPGFEGWQDIDLQTHAPATRRRTMFPMMALLEPGHDYSLTYRRNSLTATMIFNLFAFSIP